VDDARIALITSAIQSALTGARKEQDGLRRRLNDARAQAAFFFEAEDDEYSNRSESMERHLREIESRLTAAEQRLKQLDEHLMKLHELDSVLKRSFPAG
jgi:exonuclease VII large subunit